MSLSKKNILFSFIVVPLLFALPVCAKRKAPEPVRIEGRTMGTTYHITYFDKRNRNFKVSIDSLLAVINRSINNYDSLSEISIFNKSKRGIRFSLPYFYRPLQKAKEVFEASAGAFDPTVMPLVNAWGFGPGRALVPDHGRIDSIRAYIGFQKIQLKSDSVVKTDPHVQLDFGGIGQGYGADVITDFLRSKGIQNMIVELGGEGMAVGKNLKTKAAWKIGILDPNSTPENQFFKAYVEVTDKSFTTAGNYFNYREIDGKKYSHTIDPVTGYPAERAILSASVFAADCATADAWDTAFMVMGHERAIEILRDHVEIEALLIYSTPDGRMETYISPGLSAFVTLEP